MTPDGTPILGKTPYSGLFLNTGHGTLGWTMAAGSGRILAAMLSGQTADIALEGLGMERYG
jgi:D-amino-acid dehydrogenase